jgi:hypothetical protein
MTHTWKPGGSGGAWVMHSTREGHTSDSIGVGHGEDMIGPFSTRRIAGRKLSEVVAGALANAYSAGQRDKEAELRETGQELNRARRAAGQALSEIREAAARVVAEYHDPDSWYMSADSMTLLGDQLPDGMVDDYRAGLAAENRVQTTEELDEITERVQVQVEQDLKIAGDNS